VLIVQGRLDTTVHLTVGEIILSGVSSTVKELHWMEHSTHVVLLDQELDEVMRITLEFMQKV
jgi:esterase/lipase